MLFFQRPMETPSASRFHWYREPALHFILIGAALFLVHSLFRERAREADLGKITVDESELDILRADFRKRFDRNPDQREDSLLIVEASRDEILFREALAMGLDEGDEIVRRRLILKMEFFMEDIPGLEPASDGELEAFRKSDPEPYRFPARAAFTHLFFNASRHGPATRGMAERALSRLRNGGLTPEAAAALADPFIVETPPVAASEPEIAKSFGEEFARGVFAADTGLWLGPIPSPYGQHLVLVRERRDAGDMVFAEARPKLVASLAELKKSRAREAFLQGLRRKYSVEIRPKTAREADSARVSGYLP
jgi:hypothetical protein